jgi:hypothetical protein
MGMEKELVEANVGRATAIGQLSLGNCRWATVVGQLSLGNCRWATVVIQLYKANVAIGLMSFGEKSSHHIFGPMVTM